MTFAAFLFHFYSLFGKTSKQRFKAGPDPVKTISRVKLRYADSERSDWTENRY